MHKLVWSVRSTIKRLGSTTKLLDCAKVAAVLALVCLWGCGGTDQGPAVSEQQLAELRTRGDAFAGRDAEALMSDAAGMALAHELFTARCASCHGANGDMPLREIPSLVTGVFGYGDSVDVIRTTITAGRHSVMPAFGKKMGIVDIGSLVALVQGMAGGNQLDLFEKSARTLYDNHCVECHGPQGKGDPARGVPNLTDNYWQHGEAMMNLKMIITRGVESKCPAQQSVLSTAEIELLTAYVLQLRKH
jgi:cytochrome c oxidase cbb3-type subunit 3